jgi:serine phosphatase RsbU (regulator of sigma subunit)
MVILKAYPDGFVEFANCGHVLPLAIMDNRVTRLEGNNLIVGLIESATYTSSSYRLRPGERLPLATDGVTEAEDGSGRLFGDLLPSLVAQTGSLEDILRHVEQFQAPSEAQDDLTLVQLRYLGANACGESVEG